MKKILIFPILLLALVFTFSISNTAKAAEPVSGHAWSTTIGWILFNGHTNSVQFEPSTGLLSGYGWSSNIGWVKFAGDGSHPNPTINTTTGKVEGWIRACSGTVNKDCASADRTDGWDGWIELSGLNHTSPDVTGNKGVTYVEVQEGNVTKGYIKGYAWGHTNVGWVSFNSANGGKGVCVKNCPGVEDPDQVSLELISSCFYTGNTGSPQILVSWRDTSNKTFRLSRNGTNLLFLKDAFGNHFYEDKNLNVNTDYTYTLVTTTNGVDSTQTKTIKTPAACPNGGGDGLVASCTVSPDTLPLVNGSAGNFTWTATPTGGNNLYSYIWDGDESLRGITKDVSKSYTSLGSKNGKVRITSQVNGLNVTKESPNCKANVNQDGVVVTEELGKVRVERRLAGSAQSPLSSSNCSLSGGNLGSEIQASCPASSESPYKEFVNVSPSNADYRTNVTTPNGFILSSSQYQRCSLNYVSCDNLSLNTRSSIVGFKLDQDKPSVKVIYTYTANAPSCTGFLPNTAGIVPGSSQGSGAWTPVDTYSADPGACKWTCNTPNGFMMNASRTGCKTKSSLEEF